MKRRRSRKTGFGNAMTMRSFGVSGFVVYGLWFVVINRMREIVGIVFFFV